jgi:RNA polymerase sigma-70 factor (ECF subfamily)
MTVEERRRIQLLVARVADGDRAAVAPAFDALWPLLRRFAARALGSDADAEDAAQRALVKLFAQAAFFDPTRDALAWVLTIVAFECRTVVRARGRRRERPLDVDVAADVASPEAAAVQRDLEEAARSVLGTLADGDAQAIGALLAGSRPEGATFRKRLQRALARLRGAWRARHDAT